MTGPGLPDRAPPDRARADPPAPVPDSTSEAGPREPRPLIERIGLALIAVVLIAVFGAIAAASLATGELFLALMAGIGALMTAWAGGRTLLRG
jgi:hypothetical protein